MTWCGGREASPAGKPHAGLADRMHPIVDIRAQAAGGWRYESSYNSGILPVAFRMPLAGLLNRGCSVSTADNNSRKSAGVERTRKAIWRSSTYRAVGGEERLVSIYYSILYMYVAAVRSCISYSSIYSSCLCSLQALQQNLAHTYVCISIQSTITMILHITKNHK